MHIRPVSRFIIPVIAICISMIITSNGSSHVNAKEQSGITLKAEAGFGGYVKEGNWIPVHVSVENKGAAINEASIQVSYKDFSNISSIYSADVSLPTNSRKELFIYVYYPQGGTANLSVDLISNKKTITTTTARISNLAPHTLVIGLMTATPSNYSELSQLVPENGITRLVEIQPSSLPDKVQGWETLDAIIIADIDTGILTDARRKALELWVAKGGILLTVGGPKWQPTVQGLSELLPIQVSGTTNVTALPDISALSSAHDFSGSDIFDETAETVLATGKPSEGAQVLATQGDSPLVIEKTIGKGKSIFFAADPGLLPYKNWSGTFIIYDSLLNFRHAQAAWVNGRWDMNGANQAITEIAELAIPSILLICGLMSVYIIMVGPVNYIFLRIIKKREWAWVSIPAIVIFVTVVSYIYGYFYRGTIPTLNRLTVIQAWDGVSQAENDTMVGIYSPQRNTYQLESADGFLLFPLTSDDINVKSDISWLSAQNGQNTNVPGIPVEIGGMKVIGATGTSTPLDLKHNLTIVFDKGYPSISGTVTNNSTATLTEVSLVTPAQWKLLGDLAAGQSIKINLPIITTTNSPEFFFDGSVGILQTSQPQLQLNQELRRKEAFLRSILTIENGENNSDWGIYLMGWLKDPQPSASLSGFKTKNTDTTLYIHQILPAVSTTTRDYTLTTAMFEWQSSVDEASPYYTSSNNVGDYTLHFRPAIPLRFSSVKNLMLNLDSYNTPSTVEISLWDFTLNEWDIMDNVNWGIYSVPSPQKYVNKAGEVILRIKDAQNQSYIEMNKSTISMEVAP